VFQICGSPVPYKRPSSTGCQCSCSRGFYSAVSWCWFGHGCLIPDSFFLDSQFFATADKEHGVCIPSLLPFLWHCCQPPWDSGSSYHLWTCIKYHSAGCDVDSPSGRERDQCGSQLREKSLQDSKCCLCEVAGSPVRQVGRPALHEWPAVMAGGPREQPLPLAEAPGLSPLLLPCLSLFSAHSAVTTHSPCSSCHHLGCVCLGAKRCEGCCVVIGDIYFVWFRFIEFHINKTFFYLRGLHVLENNIRWALVMLGVL
jgi:hypothetical protein